MSRLEELYRLRNRITAEIAQLERRERRLPCGPDAQRVVEQVAWRYGMKPALILGRSRQPNVVRARQEAAWELRKLNLSYPQIGAVLDRDHTTVMAAVRKVEAQRTQPLVHGGAA